MPTNSLVVNTCLIPRDMLQDETFFFFVQKKVLALLIFFNHEEYFYYKLKSLLVKNYIYQ